MVRERKSLENLPESANRDHWEHANTELISFGDYDDCKHRFVHRTANEIECGKCNAGYWLSPDWEVRKGELYYKKELVF